jgi:hypothetical protein
MMRVYVIPSESAESAERDPSIPAQILERGVGMTT